MEKIPFVVHEFNRGPLKTQQLKEKLGDGVAAIFKPLDGKPLRAVQVEAIDGPGRWLLSLGGKLTWIDARIPEVVG